MQHNLHARSCTVALACLAALGVTACSDSGDGLSTAEISDRARAIVRADLGLSSRAALFSDIFIPGYEDGELMACGTVSGARADGVAIEPRRFIVQVEPARWVKWERPGASAAAAFARAWTDICRRPSDRSKVPFFPD